MTARTASATAPLRNSLETALRQAWQAMSAPAAPEATDIATEQDRIRRDSRHWLIG